MAWLGVGFMFVWNGRTLGEINTEMPMDQTGSLSLQTYAAILDIFFFISLKNINRKAVEKTQKAIINNK